MLRLLLPIAVFVSGACVMVLEVLGSRLIGPVYGTSLYVWSSIIAVTLLSLSVGYWLGGWLADRRPDAATFFLLFELAAVLIVLVPVVREPVFAIAHPFGVRGGSLVSALLLLAPPLTVLGTLSPFAVRIAADLVTTLGRTAGRLYAISTAGSLVGTLAAGFWLIPSFRVTTIFAATAVTLVLPALVYQVLAARRHAAAALVVLALVPFAATHRALPAGPVKVIDVRESFFGQLKVIEGGGMRALLANGGGQTVTDARTGQSAVSYPLMMAGLAWRAHPGGRRALVVGLGGGIIPPLLDAAGITTQSVEIDPMMVDVAVAHFGFDPRRHPVALADGRRFLADDERQWDYVILDAFGGDGVPAHLLTVEMMTLVDARLAPDGVVTVNYNGCRHGETGRPLRAIVTTLATRFPWVKVFPRDHDVCGGNIVLAAREPHTMQTGPLPFAVPAALAAEVDDVAPIAIEPGLVLTDAYNPLDLWAVDDLEYLRGLTLTTLRWDVVLAD
ncbi:MAG TPA: fused MFS/spermidine synthase [Candidatus Binatia bacterium]|nr:fused MFS/spermidine synthase [Candidatus Binatia bacterium]